MIDEVYVVYMDDYEHYELLGIYKYLTDALKLANRIAKQYDLDRVPNDMSWENDSMSAGIMKMPLE